MSKRLQAEITGLKAATAEHCIRITVDELDMFTWDGVVIPKTAPYNAAGFKFCLVFPTEYPFKAPVLKMKTRMYHPNVTESGDVCLPVLNAGKWRPKTKAINVIEELIYLIDNPNADEPVRMDVAEKFVRDFEGFYRTAAEYTSEFGEIVENPTPGISVSVKSRLLTGLAELSTRDRSPRQPTPDRR